MNENIEVTPVTEEETNGTETAGKGNAEVTEPESGEPSDGKKSYSQEEIDAIVEKRLKREREKEKEKRKSDAERIADLENRLTQSEREKALVNAKCVAEFSSYVAYTVGAMEGDFSENLATFKKENPQYFKSAVRRNVVPDLSGTSGKGDPNDTINSGLRNLFGGRK